MSIINNYMKFELTCPRCGSNKFKPKEMPLIVVVDISYLLHEDMVKERVICDICTLETFVECLEVKVSLNKEVV